MPEPLLVIACGALAREIGQLRKLRGWQHLHLKCIDARLHNQPFRIPGEIRKCIEENRHRYSSIYVAYADCGTAGAIDRVLEEEGIERLPGAHCYQFFAGPEAFERLSAEEPGTFYLTDFLVRNFDRLVIKALKLDQHPELLPVFFHNYRRVVYLAQTRSEELAAAAARAAAYLGLEYHYVFSGYSGLESGLSQAVRRHDEREENSHILA
jgi:hypothetical protein